MAVATKVGTFVISGVGSQTVAHGLGTTPKLVFMVLIPKAGDGFLHTSSFHGQETQIGGGVFNDEGQQYAWSDVTKEAGFTGAPIQQGGGLHVSNRCLYLQSSVQGLGTPVYGPSLVESTITSVDATNFTLNHLVAAGAWTVSYYAIGGSDIADTAIGIHGGSAGNVAVGFEPEFVVVMKHDGSTDHFFGTGFMTQCGYVQQCMSARDKFNDGFADAISTQWSDTRAYAFGGSHAILGTYANGFTTTGSLQFGYVAIYGGAHHLTALPGNNGGLTVPTGFLTRGLMSISSGRLTTGSSADTASESMGFHDGTTQRVVTYTHEFSSSRGQAWADSTNFGVGRVLPNNPNPQSRLTGGSLTSGGGYNVTVSAGNGRYSLIWAIGDGRPGAGGCGGIRASFDRKEVR